MGATDELDTFVREALNRGVSRDEVRTALTAAGWPEAQVAPALAAWADVGLPLAVPRPRPSLSAREAFEYLVLFGTLYTSAFALGQLLFQFINLGFPDPVWSYGRYEGITAAIRWSIAALVVAVPIFLVTARNHTRRLEASPVKRLSPVRRWFTYLTLAVAASLLIGDATSLVYSLLGGETTTRFVLKALVIGVIAGTAFLYYMSDLRRDEGDDAGLARAATAPAGAPPP